MADVILGQPQILGQLHLGLVKYTNLVSILAKLVVKHTVA
jgi:hypothetical protein